ncbi:VWA domain-containing protein [Mycobacterium sp. 21AC1]|uniref:VWA domain-containing protein n=1 Tax=[Mycobacterium] appelbergii TaxID=2939269 RepID=UPI002939150E|nr:VWA domain-containing protein [Mycobacterium sp. 21AC1]MDV3123638.1 VWA domain-containing protein [Mycobacterium sp. 21AC1]
MTFNPVLPPLILGLLAVVIVVACAMAFQTKTGRAAVWRWIGVTAGAVLLLVAAARPVLGADADAPTRVAGDSEPSIFLVVDRSAGMQPGIDQVRSDIAALLDRYPNARFAVVTFAARATLDWPLSQDTWSLKPLLATVTPSTSAPETTDVGAASTILRYQLISAVQQYPRAQNLVFYLGAGAPESEVPQRQFELPERAVDGGAVLGYGDGDSAALRGVADQIGVPYVPRTGSDARLDDALPTDATGLQAPVVAVDTERTELYWVFALGAGVLILIELYLVLRDFRRIRPTGVLS